MLVLENDGKVAYEEIEFETNDGDGEGSPSFTTEELNAKIIAMRFKAAPVNSDKEMWESIDRCWKNNTHYNAKQIAFIQKHKQNTLLEFGGF